MNLVCIECKATLGEPMDNFLACSSCGKKYSIINGIPVVLPEPLSPAAKSEEQFWRTDEIEGVESPYPWMGLVHKKNDILHVQSVLDFMEDKVCFDAKKILEIGSGPSYLSGLIKLRYSNTNVIATDIAPSALIKGKYIVGEIMKVSIDMAACDMENLPFPDEEFDYVVVFSSLHHCENLLNALKESRRVLKSGGKLLVLGEPATTFLTWLFHKRRYCSRSKELGMNEKLYTYAKWKNFLKKSHFRKFEIGLLKQDYIHRHSPWIFLYYRILKCLPDTFIWGILGCGIYIIASK